MPRPCLLLALIVAFSGTPLRLAEAASDLARSLAGPEVAGEVEAVDGGVGDESGDSIKVDVAHDPAALPTAWASDGAFPLGALSSTCSPRSAGRTASPPPPGSARRHLLLERLLC